MKNYVSYLRVSTQKQGASGLGLEAQRSMCEAFIKSHNGQHVREFLDVESGTHRDRKGLWQAIEYCQAHDCALVIAKLDRLARDVEFTFKVVNTGIEIHFTDMPVVNSMILGVFASVAQYEREMGSKRTREALMAKRNQGARLGASSDKYRETMAAKTSEERDAINAQRGRTRTMAYLESKDSQCFIKALKRVFPAATQSDDVTMWQWSCITTKGECKTHILQVMADFAEVDRTLFRSWDFTKSASELQVKLATAIKSLRVAAERIKK